MLGELVSKIKIDPRTTRIGISVALGAALLAQAACRNSLPLSSEPTPATLPIVRVVDPEPNPLTLIVSPTVEATVTPTIAPTPTQDSVSAFNLKPSFSENYMGVALDFNNLRRIKNDPKQPANPQQVATMHEDIIQKEAAFLKSVDSTAPLRSIDRHTLQIGRETYDLRKFSDRIFADAVISASLRERITSQKESFDLWLEKARLPKGSTAKVEDSVRFLRTKINFSEDSQEIALSSTGLIELADAYRLLGNHDRALPSSVALSSTPVEYAPNASSRQVLEIYSGQVGESVGLNIAQTDSEYFRIFQQSTAGFYEQSANAISNYEYASFGDWTDNTQLIFYRGDRTAFATTFAAFLQHGQAYRERLLYMEQTGNQSTALYEIAYRVHQGRLGFETLTQGVEKRPQQLHPGSQAYIYEYDGDEGVVFRDDEGVPIQQLRTGTAVQLINKDAALVPHPSKPLRTLAMMPVKIGDQEGWMARSYLSSTRP